MGLLISQFRKKKTTIEILEDLDAKIKEIERYGQSTEQRHKRIVGTFILYSVALYTLTAVIFYFHFFPASLYDQLFYIIPLLIFPLLILFTKKMVSWYYKMKISRNQNKLEIMKQQKKQILDDVTETETYKKAKEILMKFAPDQLKPQGTSSAMQFNESIIRPTSPLPSNIIMPAGLIRRRPQPLTGPTPGKIATPPMSPYQIANKNYNSPASRIQSPLPRPILPQQRSYIDKLVEYLVGDGPSNRYALICRKCESHNGMALKEEFEYFAFRCCYCNFWNPARKQKPLAPKLLSDTINTNNLLTQSCDYLYSKSDNSINVSESDSDIEVVEKPTENDNENCENSSQKSDEGSENAEKAESPSVEKMKVDESHALKGTKRKFSGGQNLCQ